MLFTAPLATYISDIFSTDMASIAEYLLQLSRYQWYFNCKPCIYITAPLSCVMTLITTSLINPYDHCRIIQSIILNLFPSSPIINFIILLIFIVSMNNVHNALWWVLYWRIGHFQCRLFFRIWIVAFIITNFIVISISLHLAILCSSWLFCIIIPIKIATILKVMLTY